MSSDLSRVLYAMQQATDKEVQITTDLNHENILRSLRTIFKAGYDASCIKPKRLTKELPEPLILERFVDRNEVIDECIAALPRGYYVAIETLRRLKAK